MNVPTCIEGRLPTLRWVLRTTGSPIPPTVSAPRARFDRRGVRRHRHESLYALHIALGQFKGAALRPAEVIGEPSPIIWALLIVVTGKYVLFLMQADNKGEGGILSLMALAQRALGQRTPIAFLLASPEPPCSAAML